jgi:hypothetical protein
VTKDVIALTPKMPDTRTLIAGLFAGGPDLGLTSTEDGAVLQLPPKCCLHLLDDVHRFGQ